MNPALVFVILIVLIAGLITWWLMRALAKDRVQSQSIRSSSTNVEALRIERSELDRDLGLGLVTQSAHAEAMRELEVRVLKEAALDDSATPPQPAAKSRLAGWSFAVLLPITALLGYFFLGAPHAVVPEIVRPPQSQQDSQIDELFKGAEAKLKENPGDAKGWYLLARAQASVGRFDDAMRSYEKLAALTPQDADMWADYADAAAGKAEGKMSGKPLELIAKALAADPKQPKALLLRGTHEIQINDLAAAEKTFTLAKSVVDPTTGFASIADNALKDIAARKAGVAPGGASATAAAGSTAGAPQQTSAPLATLSITLSADAAKAAAASPSAAVFVIVRAAGHDKGPPLAAKKLTVASLTTGAPIALTANDAMIGGGGLTAGAEVEIEARLSISGQPAAQPGDFGSEKQTIKLGNQGKTAIAISNAR